MSAVQPVIDGLEVGDRLPDVWLQPVAGERVRLHVGLAGRPMWLHVVHDARAPAVSRPDGPLPAYRIAPALQAADGWEPLAVDPRWCALFPPGAVMRVDANLRIRTLHVGNAPGSAIDVAPVPPASPRQTLACAPVLQIPDALDTALCDRLIAHLLDACGGGEASMVLVLENGQARPELDPSIKLRRESFIRDAELEAAVQALLLRRVAPEIARVFQFNVSRRDPFKLLAYPAHSGYFRPHRDNDTRDVAYRRFAVSFNLNEGAYDGGDFGFPEFGPHPYAPPTGAALVFSCSLLHEVRPVERGTRYALTTFLS